MKKYYKILEIFFTRDNIIFNYFCKIKKDKEILSKKYYIDNIMKSLK